MSYKIIIKKYTKKLNLAGTNYKNSAEAKKQKKKKSLTGDYWHKNLKEIKKKSFKILPKKLHKEINF